MFCNKCGANMDDGQTFCPHCGNKMTYETAKAQNPYGDTGNYVNTLQNTGGDFFALAEKRRKKADIAKAAIAMFLGVWLLIIPALPIVKMSLLGSNIGGTGYSFLESYRLVLSSSSSVQIPAYYSAMFASIILTIISGATMTVLGFISYSTALTGKMRPKTALAARFIDVTAFSLMYMICSIVYYVKSSVGVGGELGGSSSEYIKLDGGGIAGLAVCLLFVIAFFTVRNMTNPKIHYSQNGAGFYPPNLANPNYDTNTYVTPSADAKPITTYSEVADELTKYKKLLDEGVITDDEFAAKKKELLKEITN